MGWWMCALGVQQEALFGRVYSLWDVRFSWKMWVSKHKTLSLWSLTSEWGLALYLSTVMWKKITL